ncbi:protein RICE SALT SENSITIVE 3 isoform X2 [Cryptomeria japonica]|uniref:protein RICE SALT SENSITIVE 3 isoform X2 n=1 Tax=Cryptomeria japonica TaxID=3369 RepID=UPI0025AC7D2B|nr:protein RICE SALT SENSITIVE 3 isoform X2 [Cryptomeria japonica]
MEIEKEIRLGTHMQQQHALQSICMKSQWVYAVFWRILPRNFPPPKWNTEKQTCNRSREKNSRNWMLVWEDGFCDFNCGLQPGLFFKMTHEIYNYGEGIMGKIAATQGHKWIFRGQPDHPEINVLKKSAYSTIALVAVREGLLQLGSTLKITEDLQYVIFLQKEFYYLHTIPGVLPLHPSSQTFLAQNTFAKAPSMESMCTTQGDIDKMLCQDSNAQENYRPLQHMSLEPGFNQGSNFQACNESLNIASHEHQDLYSLVNCVPGTVVPSMSSLQALLSTLPSVTPSSSAIPSYMQ